MGIGVAIALAVFTCFIFIWCMGLIFSKNANARMPTQADRELAQKIREQIGPDWERWSSHTPDQPGMYSGGPCCTLGKAQTLTAE